MEEDSYVSLRMDGSSADRDQSSRQPPTKMNSSLPRRASTMRSTTGGRATEESDDDESGFESDRSSVTSDDQDLAELDWADLHRKLISDQNQYDDAQDRGKPLTERKYESFMNEYSDWIRTTKYVKWQPAVSRQTLLHHLALNLDNEHFSRRPVKLMLHLILWYALEDYPDRHLDILNPQGEDEEPVLRRDILKVQDAHKDTCLHVAVSKKRPEFIRIICDTIRAMSSGKNQHVKRLATAIATPNGTGQNCLQYAITKDTQTDLDGIDLLLSNADTEILRQAGGPRHNLLLHDFVDASRCTLPRRVCRVEGCDACRDDDASRSSLNVADRHVEILKKLVRLHRDALKELNANEMSPYLYHIETCRRKLGEGSYGPGEFLSKEYIRRQEELQRIRYLETTEKKLPPSTPTVQAFANRPGPRENERLGKNTRKIEEKEKDDERQKRKDIDEKDRKIELEKRYKSDLNKPRKPGDESLQEDRESVGRKKDKRKSKSSNKDKGLHKVPRSEFSILLAVKVAQTLLEESLQLAEFDDVSICLIGGRSPINPYVFTSSHLDNKTTERYAGTKFEPILIYVFLGFVGQESITATDKETKSTLMGMGAERTKEDIQKTREDNLKGFFRWLKGNRKVTRIVKLVVADQDPPCRDEVIQDCLKDLDVRFLDWSKKDLYIPAIHRVAPNLNRLWLPWSGGGLAIAGWSSEKGIRMLSKIQNAHLTIQNSSETRETSQRYFGSLEAEMGQRKIKVDLRWSEHDGIDEYRAITAGMLGNGVHSSSLRERKVDAWFDSMSRCRNKMLYSRGSNYEDYKVKAQVKVAVIDDGVDIDKIMPTVISGWQAVSLPLPHFGLNLWSTSIGGHGTKMIKIIQYICPWAGFYVGKLNTQNSISIAEQAALAIQAAVSEGCDVISMSWNIYKGDHVKEEDITLLEDALQKASSSGVLLFCAGEDGGQFERKQGNGEPWPAATSKIGQDLMRIGACDMYGNQATSTNVENVQYLFPDRTIGDDGKPGEIGEGSSASTAWAAGLAALILHCAKADHKFETRNGNGVEYADFRRDHRMNDLFNKLKPPSGLHMRSASIVDVTQITDKAGKDGVNPFAELVRGCKRSILDKFE